MLISMHVILWIIICMFCNLYVTLFYAEFSLFFHCPKCIKVSFYVGQSLTSYHLTRSFQFDLIYLQLGRGRNTQLGGKAMEREYPINRLVSLTLYPPYWIGIGGKIKPRRRRFRTFWLNFPNLFMKHVLLSYFLWIFRLHLGPVLCHISLHTRITFSNIAPISMKLNSLTTFFHCAMIWCLPIILFVILQ